MPMQWSDPAASVFHLLGKLFKWKKNTQTNCLLNDKVNEHTLHIPLSAQHLQTLHRQIGNENRNELVEEQKQDAQF